MFQAGFAPKLEGLETMQGFVDGLLAGCGHVFQPGPFLHAQGLRRTVGFQVDGGDDAIAQQHG